MSDHAQHEPTEFVILGSGVSTGIPRISCIIRPNEGRFCKVCHDANDNPNSKNRRCNVSALVRAAGHTVLIDCGKTIREASMKHFPVLGVGNVDAIVITHGHADAMLGLDDTRDIQQGPTRTTLPDGSVKWGEPKPTPVYLNEHTMSVCRNVFPYLMPPDEKEKDIKRRVSAISWKMYTEKEYFIPFYPIEGAPIKFIPVPMYHGGTYICMGFVITITDPKDESRKMTVAYLSDLNDLPENSLKFLKDLGQIDLLVVDLLTNSEYNTAHFSRRQAIECVKDLRPKEAVAVGMTCSLGLHDEVNGELTEELRNEGVSLRLAYDGERFPLSQ